MKELIRTSAPWTKVGQPLRSAWEAQAWLKEGRPSPAPHTIKARNLLAIADIFGIDVLVETGTYRGDMIAATLDRFKEIYSIEIFEPLAKVAQRRFAAAGNVKILCGDSAEVLPSILPTIDKQILFWLDGHYSGPGTGHGEADSPVIKEVETILKIRQPGDVIIIDDARCFAGSGGYPLLGEYLVDLKEKFGIQPRVADDSIFILPH